MATLWDATKALARSFVFGPTEAERMALTVAPLTALERRYTSYDQLYGLPNPITLGTLVSGPGATQLYRDAFGQSDAENSAVVACLNVFVRAYNEVPLRHWRDSGDGNPIIVSPSPLDALLRRPNPHMTLRQLRGYWVWCKKAHGNAYLYKVRAADPLTGPVIELWPISPARIAPVRYKGSGDFISAYRYYPEGSSRYTDLDPANIVHFKAGIDDQNHMLGCSDLRRLAREIATDRRASEFANRLLVNNGAASLVVEYDKDAQVTREDAAQIKQQIIADFTGENVGSVAVLSPGGKANRMSLSPSDMDLGPLRDVPHALIAGVIGVPAILAGLPVGLDSATYSNARTLSEFFTESTLIPEWEDDSETLTHQLLSDFTAVPTDYLAYDLRKARALQEDEDALYTRLSTAAGGPFLTVDEARSRAGYEAATPEQVAAIAAQRQHTGTSAPATTDTVTPPAKGLGLVETRKVG